MMNKIREFVLSNSQEISTFDEYYRNAQEVIVFGSYAGGCYHAESDIDILFILDRPSVKRKSIDFVTISPEDLKRRSWLGSELANHVAFYGLWLKGSGAWRNEVFISKTSIKNKKKKIFNSLINIYTEKYSLTHQDLNQLILPVLLDSMRLIFLLENLPVPYTALVRERLIKDEASFWSKVFKEDALGNVGMVLFKELFSHKPNIQKLLALQ